MIHYIQTLKSRWFDLKARLRRFNVGLYWVAEALETFGVALVLALLIRSLIVRTSYVYSGSMIPTLNIKDRVFVNLTAFWFGKPARGEIILFRSPYNDGKEFVKRVIGLPGETVELKRGVVYVNNHVVDFPGVDIQQDYSFFGPVTIPTGSYFVLGDNRGNSADSRVWGYVKKSDLVGSAVFTFWPLRRMQLLH